jgi:AcrR family transcriptional regulator
MEKLDDILGRVTGLYRKFGIKSVTMDDIARELGISKKTLYQFISDKDELVKKVIDNELTSIINCFVKIRAKAGNAIEELFEVNRFIFTMLKKYSPAYEYDLKKYYPEAFQILIKTKRERMYECVLENIRRGKTEGIYRNDLEEVIIARMHVSRMEHYQDNAMFSIDEITKAPTFKEIFIYHIRGMANEKGLKILEESMDKFNFSEIIS